MIPLDDRLAIAARQEGTLGAVYCPASVVDAVWTIPLSPGNRHVTPGIAAPEESVTVPEIVARFTCAAAGALTARHSAETTKTTRHAFALIAASSVGWNAGDAVQRSPARVQSCTRA
jgi:hypothetical protein